MKRVMLIFNWLCIIMFALTALLQFIDSLAYFWIPVYLFGVSICYRSTKGKFIPSQYYFAFALYIIYAVYLITGIIGFPNRSQAVSKNEVSYWMEESSDFYGLLVLLISLGCNFIWFKRIRFSETVS